VDVKVCHCESPVTAILFVEAEVIPELFGSSSSGVFTVGGSIVMSVCARTPGWPCGAGSSTVAVW
jgi:hypothetical protein